MGAHGVLLTTWGDRALRRTADSRPPIDNSIRYFDVAVHQIHAATATSGSPPLQIDPPVPPALDVEELTVLTGWAQAVAERSPTHRSECLIWWRTLARAHAGGLRFRSPSHPSNSAKRSTSWTRSCGQASRQPARPHSMR